MAALNYWANNQAMMTVNLAADIGYSLLIVVDTLANASNKKYPMKSCQGRQGTWQFIMLIPAKPNSYWAWQAIRNLAKMCNNTTKMQLNNPNGYIK